MAASKMLHCNNYSDSKRRFQPQTPKIKENSRKTGFFATQYRRWRSGCVAVLTAAAVGLAFSSPAVAAPKDDLRRANKAYKASNLSAFDRAAPRLQNGAFAPLAGYWRALLLLRREHPQAVIDFIEETGSSYFADSARAELLRYFARRDLWESYERHLAAAAAADFSPPACAEVLHRVRAAKTADNVAFVKNAWFGDKLRGALCSRAYRAARRAGLLDDDDLWRKLRATAGDYKLSAARRVLRIFPDLVSYRKLRNVARNARRYVAAKHGLRTRAERELVIVSAMVAARLHPDLARRRWLLFAPHFSPAENDSAWRAIGIWSAKWHKNHALDSFRRARDSAFADETPAIDSALDEARAWRLRAALLADDAAEVARVFEWMSPSQRRVSAWRYWRADALKKTGAAPRAVALWRDLAREEDDFYGLLARAQIKTPQIARVRAPAADPDKMAEARADADLAIAIALEKANWKTLARKIWRHKAARLPRPAQGAAARLAAENDWFLASIDAAERAGGADLHDLRYPLAHRELIENATSKFALDKAFVFGLIRQESRFAAAAVSHANARGLMQLLPSTALATARRHRYNRYRLSRLTRPETNILVGSAFLSDLAAEWKGDPVLTAAAYNAGGRRVRGWRRRNGVSDLLVFIETIPIIETRLYVKHLLANRVHYAARFGESTPDIRAFITRKIARAQASRG